MALPVSFDADLSVGPQNSYHGPWKSSGGAFYTVLRGRESDGDDGYLSLQKATDPTDSFSEQDTETLGATPRTIISIWGVQESDTVHVCAQHHEPAASALTVHYVAADISGDALASSIVIETINTDDDGPSAGACSIAVESTGSDIVVAYQGDPDMVTGTEFARIDANRSDDSGATWGGPIAVDNAGSVHWTGPVIVLGSSDRMHIFFQDDTNNDGYQRTLTSGDSLETFPSAFDSNLSALTYPFGKGISYDDTGTQKIRVPYSDLTFSGKISNAALDSADAPTVSIVDSISDTGGGGVSGGVGLAANDTDEHILFIDNATSDLFHDVNTGGGWGTDTEVLDAVTINHVSPNVYDRSGQVIAYIYDDGGTVKYNEVTLVAAVIPVINLVMAPYVSA